MRRIQRVEVKSLFGFLDHEILLHRQERITILVGPNGSGKTLLLRLLLALFRLDIPALCAVPWGSVRIEFDDGAFLEVANDLPPPEGAQAKRASQNQGLRFHHGVGKRQSGRGASYTLPATAIVTSGHGSAVQAALPQWLHALCASLPVALFDMQTVLLPVPQEGSLVTGELPQAPLIDGARAAANALSAAVVKATPLALSSETVVIEALLQDPAQRKPVSEEAFQERLADAERVWNLLATVGLAPGAAPWRGRLTGRRSADETVRALLSSSLDAFLQRTAALRELAARADLLTRMMPRYLYQKRLRVNPEQGFSLADLDGAALPVTSLSDGEQRVLLLFSRLLLSAQPAALVLIDELETSLHIDWQSQLLDDLQEVARQSNFDVVLTTHSPSLIASHWDLVCELASG